MWLIWCTQSLAQRIKLIAQSRVGALLLLYIVSNSKCCFHIFTEPKVGHSLLFLGTPNITVTNIENGTALSIEDLNPYNSTSPGLDITGPGIEIDFGEHNFFFRMFNIPRPEYGFSDPTNITLSFAHRDFVGMGNFGGGAQDFLVWSKI